jgi:hypothetical protein
MDQNSNHINPTVHELMSHATLRQLFMSNASYLDGKYCEKVGNYLSIAEYVCLTGMPVGTHKDCTYFDNVPKVLVLTIKGKDTGTVFLGATAGREPGGRRAAYPCSPTKVRRSYASVLKG